MKRYKKLTIKTLILLLVIPLVINGQNVEIQITSLKKVSNKLEINYDILDSKKIQRFDVWVEVTDSKGEVINARTFNGDVGKNLKGGKAKVITWDYKVDDITVNEDVNIVLKAEVSNVSGAVNVGNAFLKSMILPGLGLSSVDKGKPYWVLGVTAYGLLATSVLLNISSDDNYEKYELSYDRTDSDNFFKKSKNQASAATACRYSAIGIWVVSGIWTMIKAHNINNSLASEKRMPVEIYSQYDSGTKTSGLKLIYRF